MVAVLCQQPAVPGKCARIAGNVDDPGRIQATQAGNRFCSAAPGRVENDRVEPAPTGSKHFQSGGSIGADKFSICYAVYSSICLCRSNGTFVFLNTHDGGYLTCYGQRKITVAAVQVQYPLTALEAGQLSDKLQHGPV